MRIDECDRIREEEKKDRLAVAKEKKRKYGLKRLSKEENMRMTMRTEERLEIAKAKENLWRKFREGQGEMRREEEEAWETLREKIMELEEGGIWREPRKETSRIKIRLRNAKELNRDERPESVRESVNTSQSPGGVGVRDGVRNEVVESGMRSIMPWRSGMVGSHQVDMMETGIGSGVS
jgi:hypothetical protein